MKITHKKCSNKNCRMFVNINHHYMPSGLCITCYVEKIQKTMFGQWLMEQMENTADDITKNDIRQGFVWFVAEHNEYDRFN